MYTKTLGCVQRPMHIKAKIKNILHKKTKSEEATNYTLEPKSTNSSRTDFESK